MMSSKEGGAGLPVFHNCPWYVDTLAKLVASDALDRSFDFEKFKSPEFKNFFAALDLPAKNKIRALKAEADA